MVYRLNLHPAITTDLQIIYDLIADFAGPEAAEAKLADIDAGLEILCRLPHKGTLRHEIAPGLRAVPVAGKGVIVFTVEDTTIYVHAITYGGTDWQGRTRRRL